MPCVSAQPVIREDSHMPLSHEPGLTVVVPWFMESELARSLAPLIESFDPDEIEIIVVDDHSPVSLPTDAWDLLRDRPNCRVIRRDRNGGPGAARNAGLFESTGTFVAFFDAGDVPDPLALRFAYQTLIESHAQVGVSMFTSSRSMKMTEARSAKLRPKYIESSMPVALSVQPAVWRYLFRRSWISGSKLSFPELRYGEDLLFLFSVLSQSPVIVDLPYPLMHYMNESPAKNLRKYLDKFEHSTVLLRELANIPVPDGSPEIRALLDWWRLRIWLSRLRFHELKRRPFSKLAYFPVQSTWRLLVHRRRTSPGK